MTDELVEALNKAYPYEMYGFDKSDASDLSEELYKRGLEIRKIEADGQRIAELEEALGWFLNDSRFVVQVGGNPNVVPQMIEVARAALGEAK